MNRIFAKILKRYDPEDRELYLKAGFVLLSTFSMLTTLIGIMFYSYILAGRIDGVVITEIIGFAVMVTALGLLIKGRYDKAVHTILISGFAMIWWILFFASNISAITKLDTIVYIPALLAATPLMLFKNRKPMLFYFAANILTFVGFSIYIRYSVEGLTRYEWLDYCLDSGVSIVFVFFVSFIMFFIYQQVLHSLTKELSDRKTAEKALEESRSILFTHLQNTPVGVIDLDLDLNVTGWNPAAEKIFGYEKAEAMGQSLVDLIVPRDVKGYVENVFKQLESGVGGDRSVNENVTRDGDWIICDWYNTLIRNKVGEVIGLASIVNDITENRKIQEMMIQTEKMMSMGGMAAGMAHEINNPLAGIMQSAQVIHNRLVKDLPANIRAAEDLNLSLDTVRSYLEKRGILNQLNNISLAGQRASRIINNMLDFSKKSQASREYVQMPDLVSDTIELAYNDYNLKKQYDFKNMDIRREEEPGLPAVWCERTKIQQVLFNLLKNAAEAMTETQDLRKSELTIRLKKAQAMVQIEVEDNGPGMAPKISKRIFEPFFTTKDLKKGTGLGLSVSYFIITDDHNGEMSVKSTLDQGTCFIIRLPENATRNPESENRKR